MPAPQTNTSHRLWSRTDWAMSILVCLLVLAFYRHIALGNGILTGVDAFTYFYPYRQYAAEMIRSGHLPLWNPYLFMGAPFIGNAQTAVFYPLNLALCWLDGPRLVTWSIVLHVALAAISTYCYARLVLHLSPHAALLAACAFACGGFLSGMVEHVNQLNVCAWFPVLLLLWEYAQRETGILRGQLTRVRSTRSKTWFLVPLSLLIGIGLLAGHTQSSYICLFGLGVYAVMGALFSHKQHGQRKQRDRHERRRRIGAAALRLWHVLWQLGLVVLVGALLAAVQLWPTIELSVRSIRGGGLSYREAVAFSLKPLPRLLRYTLFPPRKENLADVFGGDFFTEYVAYIGTIPLLLAIGWVGSWVVKGMMAWRQKGSTSLREIDLGNPEIRVLILAGLGAFLAVGGYNPFYWVLYKLVPGFGLFRVPARWLFLYAFGAAMLAGVGLQKLWDRCAVSPPSVPPVGEEGEGKTSSPARGTKRRTRLQRALPFAATLIVALTTVELFLASEAMPLAHPTAPEAFSSLRTAPAHILAAQSQSSMPGRFLSLSDILFDPGDQREMALMFAGQLDDEAIYDYVVSAKRKEILAPNLPLAWRIYAVDGYDGGVLPLQRYVDLQTLFLPPDQLSPDGRLRENLERIPPFRLLSLLGVRYVITDKVHDAWIDDVFYDLAFEAVLSQGTTPGITTTDLPSLAANALGIVAYAEGITHSETDPENHVMAEMRLFATNQADPITLSLTSEMMAATATDRKAARLRWDRPLNIERLEIDLLDSDAALHIQGLTLIDERDGSSVPVLLSGEGRVRLVHSGDVKLYELPDALPRAYVVHKAVAIEDDAAALAALADPGFDPAQQVILHAQLEPDLVSLEELSGLPTAEVTTKINEPERIALEVALPAPGYLVLSDAIYPGWKATVDGVPAEILRANVHFRAVFLNAGTHVVEFTFKSSSYTVGLSISIAAFVAILVALALATRRSRIADV